MSHPNVIHWFRQDLRLRDNPALSAAADHGQVLPIFILDDEEAGPWSIGGASRCWLQRSLKILNHTLNGQLQCFTGRPERILPELIRKYGIRQVYWNRCCEPWRVEQDRHLETSLPCPVATFNGSLLWEPRQVLKTDHTPYRVFTPYFERGCANAQPPRLPLPAPAISLLSADHPNTPDTLDLLPAEDWHETLFDGWEPGERGAANALSRFIQRRLSGYSEQRDYPSKSQTSELSPHLHYGEISPNQVWYACQNTASSEDSQHFHRELGWREFSYYLLYHFPLLPHANLQHALDDFPWQQDRSLLSAWQKGVTGIPMVDAGMRELWHTGFMHNRVRMVVASFLVKNLRIHWIEGAKWFWDCLFDADLASNSASWQWVAGCGADAAPYFRIFNPVRQGQRFDPAGVYIRQWLPELRELPDRFLFCPWEAPEQVLADAGITLGQHYPKPVVDLRQSREQALAAYRSLKSAAKTR